MTRVLVTGATGFIGSHVLCALLATGVAVVALGRSRPQRRDVEFAECDLLDAAARRRAVMNARADRLLHLAWVAEPGIYWRSASNLDWSAATLDLLRTFGEAGGRRAVLVGSCAEYTWGLHDRLSEVATPCEPHTLYGSAKDATRRLAAAYAREAGLSLAWARVFFLYGPGERSGRLVADAIAALLTNVAFEATHGRQKRDYLHVADVAGALAALLESNVEGSVNIGSGRAVAVRDILETLGAAIGRRDALRFGARPEPANDPAIIEADIARLSREVGFSPRFGLADGLADAIAAARAIQSSGSPS